MCGLEEACECLGHGTVMRELLPGEVIKVNVRGTIVLNPHASPTMPMCNTNGGCTYGDKQIMVVGYALIENKGKAMIPLSCRYQ
jgi:hypothetical protein